MAKVWIADKMSARAIEVFKAHGIEVDYRPGLSDAEQLAIVADYDGIAVRSSTTLKGALLDAATRVKVIGRAGIGVDNVDVDVCSRRGTVVMNTPFGNTITTAELAVAHIVAAARMIPQASASTRAGLWEKSRFMGMELTGKKAGVIGAGNIGAIVCDRLKGLHMAVYVYDPFISDERAAAMGVTKVATVAELAAIVDVLTVHVPLLPATRNLIDADILAAMKPGSIVVNCARGGIVNEAALYEACKSGHLRAAALDVYEQEPARENPLFELENVSFTPHIGASTDEAQENVAVQIAEQMSAYLLSGVVTNAVNVPSLSVEEQRLLAPYLLLAQRMGSFLGQTMRPGYSRMSVHLEGHAASINRKPLINAMLQGLLSQSMEEVNAVNAGMLARERGIELIESARENSDSFATMIRLQVEGDEGMRCVSGTLFDETRPRLISFDTCGIEMAPAGNLIFLQNEDRPGVIAAIGAILARANINIGDFRLGRREDTRNAVALIQVDTLPSEAVLAELAELPNMLMVRFAELGEL
ncbi:MAG: phosphoglycerate dehydrogenase [Zetaproteobacteria bacterium CG12_big_fil_rev_8_21_14_0_65_54_13]|nr:MAG: phosphoglycerate dehydrogenase [Zetaproteobacteria bacterium CG12_big_fil_rev_8_21_14_0_65_54_13]PIX55420.1 MAG: phosphoglycerate dehydrogenase [Zetaproteobacteria bacterium CG_4_10_14_3_um_filter_54_28]PJA27486.1 MAG: phosphoglycerate dehydrogenase [Zetaproteobacteria bacterium CG_4_9_14_3_um_filter_54_145]